MKKTITEIYFLRSIACLSIVLMHSLTSAYHTYNLTAFESGIIDSLRMTLMYATPTFVFISEFIISYSYKNGTPIDFVKRRFKYIFVPYMIIAILYAGNNCLLNGDPVSSFVKNIIYNILLGNFIGYFILILFQFYLLHNLFDKYIAKRIRAKYVIAGSFILNLMYLLMFNFYLKDLIKFVPLMASYWYFFSRIPFIAWISYFVVAYYCGKYYTLFFCFLSKYKFNIVFYFILSFFLVQIVFHLQIINGVNSKRIDVLIYTFGAIFLLFYISSKIKQMPLIFIFISRYSFGIYLLHYFFQDIFKVVIPKNINILMYIDGSFVFSILCAIFTTFILNKFKWGVYVVGKIGTGIPKQKILKDKINKKHIMN